MKTSYLFILMLFSLMLASLTGCGDPAKSTTVVAAVSSQKCVDCHANNSRNTSSVTGDSITGDWLASTHNTSGGAGCGDCHGAAAHFHRDFTNCKDCHAAAHSDNGNSCGLCHGGSAANVSDCRTCHASAHSDPESCAKCHDGALAADKTMKNPDAVGRCFSCHLTTLPPAHFRNMTAGPNNVSSAMYVTRNYENSCTSCHDPHKGDKGVGVEHRSWAVSGHGAVNGVAWATEDFKESVSCLRCHTTTGFVNFATSGYTMPTSTWAIAGDKGREVLTCKGCHANYDFKNSVRKLNSFTTPYNANGGSNFIPDLGESNLCIPCHTGRTSQADILALSDAAMADTSFKNPHYMPAAGIMYLKSGFINFTTAVDQVGSTYYKNYRLVLTGTGATGYPLNGAVDADYGGIVGGVGSAHRALGTPTIRGRETWMRSAAVYGLWETKGPCVTCHIKADLSHMPAVSDIATAPFLPAGTVIPTKRADGGHSFSAISADAGRQVCMPCHNDAGDFNAAINSGDYVAAVEEKLLEAKPYFLGGLDVIAKLLDANYGIAFDNTTYPYFFEKGTTTAVRDWTRFGALSPATARKLMGACHNLKLLRADAGAYVHGRNYSQRLIFDTIDFLNDGVMNANAAATIVALGDPLLFPDATADHWLFKAGGVRK